MFKPDPKLIAASAIVTLTLMVITSPLDDTTRLVIAVVLCLAALVVHRTLK
ncbi:MAG: hypothetical protein RLZZ387_1814 [Chloroflexota bacterium]|jgi:hypothetical protein